MLRHLNLSSNRQADLRVHDGRDNAVYIHPYEHDARCRPELSDTHQPYGSFGENFTTDGLVESQCRHRGRVARRRCAGGVDIPAPTLLQTRHPVRVPRHGQVFHQSR